MGILAKNPILLISKKPLGFKARFGDSWIVGLGGGPSCFFFLGLKTEKGILEY